jgi:hypothetical protein
VSAAWRWWLVAVAVTAFVLAALPLLANWTQLPDPLAVHWHVGFEPDGKMTKRLTLLFTAALIGSGLGVALIGARGAYVRGRAMRLVIVTLIGGLAAMTSATIVAHSLRKAVWTDAEPLSVGSLLLLIGVPLAAAALAYVVGMRAWSDARAPQPVAAPALALAAGARPFFSSGASNGWLLLAGAALLTEAIVLFAGWPWSRLSPLTLGIHALAFVLLEHFSTIRVTIDGRGLAVRYGHLGLWTRRLSLDRIAAAQAVNVDALEQGGWGYRGGLRLFGKAAIVVRSGDALRLELRDGKQLFVTVDDAVTGARLLNALLQRGPAATSLAAAGAAPGA